MRKHPVRKFFTLLVVYAAIIVGIFVLQFKTESIISKTIGALHISLAQTESEESVMSLRNQFKVNFKGLNFNSTESNPAYGIKANGEKEALELTEYIENELNGIFVFKDGSRISFNLTSLDSDSELYIYATPSALYTQISIPYAISSSYSVDNISDDHSLITAKNNFYTLNAHDLTDGRITLTKSENTAKFQNYDPSKRFTYEAVAGLQNSDAASFASISKNLREQIISKTQAILAGTDADNLSEAEIVAYVAEMAALGKYNEVLDSVPESFKKGNKRTYLSTPYFNNLASMNRSLVMQTGRYESMVSNAVSSKNMDIFTASGISDYILREKRTSIIKQLITLPASVPLFTPTVNQAAGILSVYADIYKKDSEFALNLSGVTDKCLEVIAENCNLENNTLTVHQENTELSLAQTVTIGNALVKAGKILNKEDVVSSGYLIINTALSSQTPDLHTLSELYSILAPENTYYPHTEILGYYGNTCVWAWTCASGIQYSISDDSIVSINIDFPVNHTHHIIFNGIPNFHSQIEIQHQMFRTDPRFETYNSSGYVYQNDAKTLLIKSRHKAKVELIRLFCDPVNNFTDSKGNLVVTHARQIVSEKPVEAEPAETSSTPEVKTEAEPEKSSEE